MADTKISALTALTGANVDTANDVLPIVDTSVTTTKKITVDELNIAISPAWTTPAFSAGDYTASSSMTWTVAGGDVTTNAYQIRGKAMTMSFIINATTVGGTPSVGLRIAVPASKTITKTMITACRAKDNDVPTTAYIVASAGLTYISIQRTDDAVWTASTDLTQVAGQITFEIN